MHTLGKYKNNMSVVEGANGGSYQMGENYCVLWISTCPIKTNEKNSEKGNWQLRWPNLYFWSNATCKDRIAFTHLFNMKIHFPFYGLQNKFDASKYLFYLHVENAL